MASTIQIRRGINSLYAPGGTITLLVGEMAYATDTGTLWIGSASGNRPINISWRGTYSAETTYSLYNAVVYQGSSYIWINATAGNGHTPSDDNYWDILASKGTDGTNGLDGTDGESAFVYIAYASDDTGTDFTLSFDPDLDYIAIKNTTTAIVTPVANDFSGLWKNYKGTSGGGGTSDHSLLSNLAYADSGHTGFASADSLSGKATQFPGICATCGITSSCITIDYDTRVLTLTPPNNGTMYFFTDGDGVTTKHTVTDHVDFPAFTDTSGIWYFYFDSSGTAVTTQTPWTDFNIIAPVYRILWNNTLSGSAKAVCEVYECHENTIPGDDHVWKHKYGAVWLNGFDIFSNTLSSGVPNSDGRNAVIGLSAGMNADDNLEYTIANSHGISYNPPSPPWKQDLGSNTPASLNATNSALLKVRYQDSAGRVFVLPATNFPFAWSASTNAPEYITSTGTRTPVSNNYFFVSYVYSITDPRYGEAVRVVMSPAEYSSITNARANSWSDIQAVYTTLNDNEVRLLYKLIFEHKTTYDVGSKYSVLREVSDQRKAILTQVTNNAGSILASAVQYVPSLITESNVQSAIDHIGVELAGRELLTSAGWTSTGWTGGWSDDIHEIPAPGSTAEGWTHTTGNTSVLSYDITSAFQFRNTYEIRIGIDHRSAGSVTFAIPNLISQELSTTGIHNVYFCTGEDSVGVTWLLNFTPTSDFDGEIFVSIKESKLNEGSANAAMASTVGDILTILESI